MIAKHNKISLIAGIAGVVLQYGSGTMVWDFPRVAVPGVLLGTLLISVGLAYYLKAKARSLAFLIVGVIPVIGLVVLGLLSDYSVRPPAPSP